jgi:DNA polymerase III sliding clamp (beta) subunit (PCNA family)
VEILSDPACDSAAIWQKRDYMALLKFGKFTMITKCIAGNFPNYLQVIPDPATYAGSCTFPPAALPNIVNWLRQYKNETVCLKLAANRVTFEVSRPNKGVFSTHSAAHFTGQPPPEVAYNTSFLADALAMELPTLDLIDEMSPAVLTDGTIRYVLMPMKTLATIERETAKMAADREVIEQEARDRAEAGGKLAPVEGQDPDDFDEDAADEAAEADARRLEAV